MSGVQFDIRVNAGASVTSMESVVSGLTDITTHLNLLNQNFVSFSQKSLSGFTAVAEKTEEVNRKVEKTESLFERMGKGAFYLNNIQTAISGIANDFDNAVQPGIAFNSSQKDLQAITGVTDEQLKKIGASARQNAKDFGIDAATSVESYKMFLSQLSPEIAKNDTALAAMGVNASILSKQLKGDTASATEILTTAMNQYGVSTKDPIEASRTMAAMMNIMSAAAQEGSAELPQIKSALQESGMMAKTANVSFSELNGAIQVLDKAGKKGAEGGVAIRNVLAEISQGNMMPRQQLAMLHAAGIDVEALGDKTKSFADRLRILSPIVNDNAAMTKMFGKENVAAGIALVQGAAEMDRYTTKITGTNSATEMANVVMGSFSEKLARTNAWLKDLGISIFAATEGFIPFIHFGMGGLQVMANLAQATTLFSMIAKTKLITSIGSAVVGMGSWIATTAMATAEQWAWNIAMTANPIGLIVVGIGAAIAAVAALIYWWDDIWTAVKNFTTWLAVHNPFSVLIDTVANIFPGFKSAMDNLFNWVSSKFEALLGWIKKAFGWIKSLFGSDTSKDVSKAAVEDMAKQIKDVKIEGITVKAAVSNDKGVLDGYDPHAKKQHDKHSKNSREMASNISSGGGRASTINLVIQKLTGIDKVYTTNLSGTAKQAANNVIEELLTALNSVNAKAQASTL